MEFCRIADETKKSSPKAIALSTEDPWCKIMQQYLNITKVDERNPNVGLHVNYRGIPKFVIYLQVNKNGKLECNVVNIKPGGIKVTTGYHEINEVCLKEFSHPHNFVGVVIYHVAKDFLLKTEPEYLKAYLQESWLNVHSFTAGDALFFLSLTCAFLAYEDQKDVLYPSFLCHLHHAAWASIFPSGDAFIGELNQSLTHPVHIWNDELFDPRRLHVETPTRKDDGYYISIVAVDESHQHLKATIFRKPEYKIIKKLSCCRGFVEDIPSREATIANLLKWCDAECFEGGRCANIGLYEKCHSCREIYAAEDKSNEPVIQQDMVDKLNRFLES